LHVRFEIRLDFKPSFPGIIRFTKCAKNNSLSKTIADIPVPPTGCHFAIDVSYLGGAFARLRLQKRVTFAIRLLHRTMASESTNPHQITMNGAESTPQTSNGPRRKLHGRAFYQSIGSPKIVLAPMVDQSEFVRSLIAFVVSILCLMRNRLGDYSHAHFYHPTSNIPS